MYVKEFFYLNDETINSMTPKFGYDQFGEAVFYRTYSRDTGQGNEKWNDVVRRVTNGIFSIRKDHYLKNGIEWNEPFWQAYARRFAITLFKMHWLPPGRGLWAMGTQFMYERGAMCLYNCFSGDTKFLADGQIKTLEELVNQTVSVIGKDGKRHLATVKHFGKQQLQHVVFKPTKGKSKYRISYRATKNHRWILKNNEVTTNLKEGDKVIIKPGNIQKDNQDYKDGLIHGMIFADGTITHQKFGSYITRLELFGEKESWRETLKQSPYYSHTQNCNNGLIFESIENLKKLPKEKSLEYKQGFFDGWTLFDGYSNNLDTTNIEASEWVKEYSGILNYVVTGHSIYKKDSNYGKRKPLHRLKIQFEEVEFSVSFILPTTIEDVYCVVEPETQSFQLSYGIITGNCAYTDILKDTIGDDCEWLMDSLMVGVGVGFGPTRDELRCYNPLGSYWYIIPDTKEGWARSVRLLIDAYTKPGCRLPKFDYSKIRPAGSPIKGFGGISNGSEDLKKLHEQISICFYRYMNELGYDVVRLKTDLANFIGCCVVAGNVRRSAEIAMGDIEDPVFADLKDYEKHPDRMNHGYMSNNTVKFTKNEHFEKMDEIARRVIVRGEPGGANLLNFPYGRLGKRNKYPSGRVDKAHGLNPLSLAA